MQTELRQARNILTDLTDEVAQQIFDINDLQTECRGLQGQIVQSPERIKREIGTCPRPDARAYAWMLPGPCGTAPPVAPRACTSFAGGKRPLVLTGAVYVGAVTMGSQVEAEKENVSTSERKARDLLVRTEALGGTKQVRMLPALYLLRTETFFFVCKPTACWISSDILVAFTPRPRLYLRARVCRGRPVGESSRAPASLAVFAPPAACVCCFCTDHCQSTQDPRRHRVRDPASADHCRVRLGAARPRLAHCMQHLLAVERARLGG